jgi:hypothetical protein
VARRVSLVPVFNFVSRAPLHHLSGPRARNGSEAPASGPVVPAIASGICASPKRIKGRQGTPEGIWSRGILVYPPVLHDNLEVLCGIGDQVNILQRVALDQQQIGERALFHDAELP